MHCTQGRSRSAAVVAAFLMQKEKISLGKAKSVGFGADFMGLYQESWDLTMIYPFNQKITWILYKILPYLTIFDQ